MRSASRKPGAFLAVGAGAGTAIGVATHNIAVWVGVGVAFGVVLMIIAKRRGSA